MNTTTHKVWRQYRLTGGDKSWKAVGRCTRKPGRMINMPEEIIVAIVYIISFWQRGNNLEPMVICSTMRANKRSTAPVETMRDETSMLIIAEKEKSWPHRPSIIATSCYHLNPSWRWPSQPKEEGRPRRDKTDLFGDPENGVTLK